MKMPDLKTFKAFTILNILLLLLFAQNFYGQKATMGFAADYSDIFERLAEKKTANPKIKPDELVVFANDLLALKGLNFEFELDQSVCNIVAERRKKLKPGEPDKISGRFLLQPKTGNATNVFIPNILPSACGKCFATLPVIAADATEFIVLIQNRNIGFLRANGLYLNEVALLDNKDTNKVVRRWTIPFRSIPLGVSPDGTRLYLPLPSKNFDELALVFYENSVIEFVQRADAELNEKPSEVKGSLALLKLLSFGTDEKKRILRYAEPCAQ